MSRGGINRSGFNNLIRRMRSARRESGGDAGGSYYYWLLGEVRGVRVVDGPFQDEMSAKTVARDKMDTGRWRCFPLKTRDPARAKSILKHQLAVSGSSVEDAMQPMQRPTNITSVDVD